MKISLDHYFGAKISHPDATEDRQNNARDLLEQVEELLELARQAGVYEDWIDPDTNTQISGAKGGAGDGGFRLQSSNTGAPSSPHKQGMAVDVYDPFGKLDAWLDTFDRQDGAMNEVLESVDLYREATGATPGWCHLQTKRVRSGKRTFQP